MKSVLIQQSQEKFLQNCLNLSLPDIKITNLVVNNNLYQTYFTHKPDFCIFSGSMINREIIQFCQDHSKDTVIYFFHIDNVRNRHLAELSDTTNIRNISYDTEGVANISIPEFLINEQLFYSVDDNKNNGIVCFMDGLNSIPIELLDILYPKTKIPIKLFNSSTPHYQNLGVVTEKDKANLLQTHKYFLDLEISSGYSYRNEAVVCGSIPVSIIEIQNNSFLSKVRQPLDKTPTKYSSFLQKVFTS